MITSFTEPALLLASDAAHSDSLLSNPLLWRWINLLVFVLVIVYLLRNKVRVGQVFDSRAQAITRELEQAKHDRQEAEARLAEVDARLGRLDQEMADIRAETARESAREVERIRQSADADAEKIRQMARREIDGAMKAARTELRAFVAEASVEMAERIIRREIRPEDNSRMLNRYVNDLGEVSE
jgi:F-type H+-transporting ATPase subunit b